MQPELEQQTNLNGESIFQNLVDLEPYEKSLKNARVWLYVIAALQFGMGIYEYLTIDDKTLAVIAFGIDAFIALIFFTLSLWSKKKPTIAFTIALSLYVLFQVSFIIIDPANILKGILLKIFAVVALVKAMRDAKKYEIVKASIGQGQ